MNLKKTVSRIVALLAVSALCGCSTISTPKGTSKGYNSARFIAPKGKALAGTEASPELNRLIKDVITTTCRQNDIMVRSAEADLVIAYLLVAQDNVSTTKLDDYYGYNSDAEKIVAQAHKKGVVDGAAREEFQRGAIVIDVVDAETKKLVYRGYAVRDILADISDADRRARVAEAVQEALAGFFR